MLTDKAAIAANRFGLGARPGDAAVDRRRSARLARAAARARRGARRRSGAAARIGPRAAESSASCAPRAKSRRRRARTPARGRRNPAHAQPGTDDPAPPTPPGARERLRRTEPAARHRRAGDPRVRPVRARALRRRTRTSGTGARSQTDRPFVERLVHFWSNHFAVSADKQLARPRSRASTSRKRSGRTSPAISTTCCSRRSATPR